MKALLQRAQQGSVSIGGKEFSQINQGIVVLLGIEKHDDKATAAKCLEKIFAYRIFSDEDGKMNLSAKDIEADLLIVSQFTLAAQTQKGLRPGFSSAAPPEQAEGIYEHFIALAQEASRDTNSKIATGQFGADMQVALVNDGPVTFLLSF